MRKRTLLLALGVLIPLAANALDFTDVSSRYKDAPFSTSEAAGISLLTSIGAVQGNPNGTFTPLRTLNRAEFVKIALASHAGTPVSSSDAASCFPDVHAGDWFSSYVCVAKKSGAISGYPDGLFHPERSVNYVEALKILCELNAISSATAPADPWYQKYILAARADGLLLPSPVSYGDSLTRGQMARLAAGFVAFAQGQLAQYRQAELGISSSSASSSSSSSSSSVSSTSSSSVSSSSSSLSSQSSSSVSAVELPARSHFLLIGQLSKPISNATFRSPLEPVRVTSIIVTLKRKITSIDSLEIVDQNGTDIGRLPLDDVYDPNDLTYRALFTGTGAYELPKDVERTLAVEARMKSRDEGGISGDLVQVDTIQLITQGEWSQESQGATQTNFIFPMHQTTQGDILSVTNAMAANGSLPVGSAQMLAAFTLSGMAVSGAPSPQVQNMDFQVSKSSSVTVTNWQLGTQNSRGRCSSLVMLLSIKARRIECSKCNCPMRARSERMARCDGRTVPRTSHGRSFKAPSPTDLFGDDAPEGE